MNEKQFFLLALLPFFLVLHSDDDDPDKNINQEEEEEEEAMDSFFLWCYRRSLKKYEAKQLKNQIKYQKRLSPLIINY